MQYALMIYAEPGYDEALSDAEREAVHAEYLGLDWTTPDASRRARCSRPRRRPACAWSVAGR